MVGMSLRLSSSLLRTSVSLLVARKASGVAASERLWRSFLYVPGDQERKINKISNLCNTTQITPSIPDIVVLDCEDAVSAENKALARRTIATSMQARSFQTYRESLQRCVSLRINAPSTGLAADDLHVVLSASVETMKQNGGEWPGPDYISVPKTESIGDLQWVEAQVMKIFHKHSVSRIPQLALIGMIESPSSLMNMRVLCTAALRTLKLPLVAMVFGSDDYCAGLGVPHTSSHQEALFARQYMVTMCRAYGLAALDLVETHLTDMEMFRQSCDFGAGLGYDGKQLIHPRQIEPANEAFAPSQERIEWAKAVVEAASAQAGSSVDISALTAGAFAFRGHMIDRSTVRQAEHVVALAKLMSGRC